MDVIVSSVVTPNHVFLQQLTHPTFPMLERQSHCMLLCYTQDTIVPQLPRPIEGKLPFCLAVATHNLKWSNVLFKLFKI